MGVKTITTDDFDGTELGDDVQPLRLTVGDKAWQLYLSDKSKDALYKALDKFTKTAMPARLSESIRTVSTPAASGQDLNAIRAWARENGYEVADRGRIKQSIVDAYEKDNEKEEADS